MGGKKWERRLYDGGWQHRRRRGATRTLVEKIDRAPRRRKRRRPATTTKEEETRRPPRHAWTRSRGCHPCSQELCRRRHKGVGQKAECPKTRRGGSANPHKQGKAGVAREDAPAVQKAGVRTSSVPHQEESFRSCVGITLPQHHGEHATQQGCVDWGVGARIE